MDTIGFIGAGNMAEALIKGVINAESLQAEDIYLVNDIRSDRLELLYKPVSGAAGGQQRRTGGTG